jgi:hypothetical protein
MLSEHRGMKFGPRGSRCPSKTTVQTGPARQVYKPNQNPVVVVYRRPMAFTDRALQLFGFGNFIHCELWLPKDQATFAIFVGGEMQCSAVLSRLYVDRPDLFAWHMLVLNDVEYERLRVWNIEQVYKHCAYNLKDLAFKILPAVMQKSYVKDLSKEQAHAPRSMFCSQAVLLALREACSGQDGSPHIAAFTTSLNSRTTTPNELANRAVKDLGMGLRHEPVPMTNAVAQTYIRNNMLFGACIM